MNAVTEKLKLYTKIRNEIRDFLEEYVEKEVVRQYKSHETFDDFIVDTENKLVYLFFVDDETNEECGTYSSASFDDLENFSRSNGNNNRL